MITKQTIYFTMVHHPTRGKIRAGNACTKEGIPKFYTARTKRAVNSLTVERGPKGGAA